MVDPDSLTTTSGFAAEWLVTYKYVDGFMEMSVIDNHQFLLFIYKPWEWLSKNIVHIVQILAITTTQFRDLS